MTVYIMGICIPGCLYDTVRGPYDTEEEARANVALELREYGNPYYTAEIFPMTFSGEEELAEYLYSF